MQGRPGVLWASRQGLVVLCPPACRSASIPSMKWVSSPTCGLTTARGKAPGSWGEQFLPAGPAKRTLQASHPGCPLPTSFFSAQGSLEGL